jgi:hypothetical protein
MRGISPLGILVGASSDLVLTLVLSSLLVIWVYATTDLSHLPREQAQAALALAMSGPSPLYIAQVVVGLLCSVLGGFIAAALSRERHLLNGVLAGLLLNLFLIARGVTRYSGVDLVLIALSVACYPAGAALRLKLFPPRASAPSGAPP